MTANLVARKTGDGHPDSLPSPERTHNRTESDPEPNRPRKIFVPLSHEEHERLIIAAAKTKKTPHQVVHTALEYYFQKLAADAQCQCIADVCTRGCAAN